MQQGYRLMDEIINFYKNELTTKNLVLKYIKKYYLSFIILVAITALLMVGNIISDTLQNNKVYNYFICLLIFIFMALFLIINYKAKNIIEKKYNIKQNDIFFGGYSFYKLKIKKLRLKILDINPSFFEKPKNIDILIELLTEEAERLKPSNLFNKLFLPGLLLGFIIPIWSNIMNQYFNILYSEANMENITSYTFDAIYIALIWCILILFIFLIIGAIRMMFRELIEKEYKERKNLIDMVKRIRLDMFINDID